MSCASILGACGGASPPADAGGESDAGGEVAPACFLPALRDPDFSTTTAWSAPDGVALGSGAATFSLPAVCEHLVVAQTRAATPSPLRGRS